MAREGTRPENNPSVAALTDVTFYRRRLPHWHPDDAAFFVTWRLSGSLPQFKRDDKASHGANFLGMDRALDSDKAAPRWLAISAVADSVQQTLLAGAADLRAYDLGAWVIMPNHMHVVLRPLRPLRDVLRMLKSASARGANSALDRTGMPFWQRESYDHWIRSETEEAKIVRYVEMNPVRAGLVEEPSTWRYSSAFAGHGPAPLKS